MSNYILCGYVITDFEKIEDNDIYSCKCLNCGDYEISGDALRDLPKESGSKLYPHKFSVKGVVPFNNIVKHVENVRLCSTKN